MHNCKDTKEQISELLLDGAKRAPDETLSAELRRCAECGAEFDVLSGVFRMTNRLKESAMPAETYWTGYHAKLRQKLFRAKAQRRKEVFAIFFAPLRLCARSSVRVPVPVCIAVLVTFSILSVFAMRGVRSQLPPPASPAVVRVPVEVPLVQEKIITRIVYRERRLKRSQQTQISTKAESTLAKSQKSQNEGIPASLTGFKPTDEIKLTVIKGGSSNDK